MILEPGLVRIGKRKELHGSKLVEDVWTSAYCTFLKVKDSDSVIAFGLNNSYQLGAIDMENRYQPDLIQSLKFEGKLTKVVGGMHHTLFLDSNGKIHQDFDKKNEQTNCWDCLRICVCDGFTSIWLPRFGKGRFGLVHA